MKLYFSDALGQITPESVMRSDQIQTHTYFYVQCMSWLRIRMKIKYIMNALEWSRHYRAIF